MKLIPACTALLLSAGLFSAPTLADKIRGTGELSGKVTAPAAFTAAKVFAHLKDKNVTYIVFTEGGKYSAVNMIPGTYEVWVDERGFSSEKKTVTVAAEKKAQADIALQTVAVGPNYIGTRIIDRKIEAFDKIYPPGPGRDIMDRTCFVCHGYNFISAQGQNRQAWDAVINYMMDVPRYKVPTNSAFLAPDRLNAADREVVLDYLAANFGEGAQERMVEGRPDGPRDEAVLGKAQIIEYTLPNTADYRRVTQETSFDSKGNVWVTNVNPTRGALTRIDPRTGEFKDFETPAKDYQPHGVAVDGDDTVWFASLNYGLAHLDPETGKFDVYGKTSVKRSGALTPFLDSKGNAYWTDGFTNEVGRWDRKTEKWKRWETPSKVGTPYGMVIDQKDRVWYAEFHGCAIVQLDAANDKLIKHESPSAPCLLRRPGVDSKGNIWYGIYNRGRIEKLDPETGKITVFQVPEPYADPYDVWVDPDDNVWSSSDNYLIKLDPKTSTFSYYPTPTRTDAPKITITREGAVWYPPRGGAYNKGTVAGANVLYPDKSKMKTLGAYFSPNDANAFSHRYKGPFTKVAGNAPKGEAKPKSQDPRNDDLGAAAE